MKAVELICPSFACGQVSGVEIREPARGDNPIPARQRSRQSRSTQWSISRPSPSSEIKRLFDDMAIKRRRIAVTKPQQSLV
jgi:hypothetical protein